MKITFFIYSLSGGGAERVTAHLASHWSDEHEISIATCSSPQEGAYEVSRDVNVVSLNMASESQNVLSGLLNNAKRIRKLRKHLKSTKPDVLISMMTTSNIISALACKGLPIKSIGSERNFPTHPPISPIWNTIRKYTYAELDVLVSQTEATRVWLQRNTKAKNVVTIKNPLVLPLPVQEPIITPPTRGDDDVVILGVGRLVPQKQFDHLISVFAKIKTSFPKCRLLIVGQGPMHDQLQQQIHELGLISSANIQPRVGNIGDWYRHCDILAMTSFSEGFPNTLIEAMAAGKAVISYDCEAGPAEIINHDVTGILVKPNDTAIFHQELLSLVRSKSLRLKLGENARRIALELNIEKIADQWASYFPNYR